MDSKAHTTESLRQTLFETIEGVLGGAIETKNAAAVANLADKIIKTADLEMKYSRHMVEMDRGSDDHGIQPGPMLLGVQRKGAA